tara:strand:+ start:881 stop:1348 length:468 start_codon:yes stop_codon:yes gene_type:complete
MNIQDTINKLNLQEVKLPRILNQRVNTIIDLQKKVELAKNEVASDNSDENKSKLTEIEEYLDEYFEDAVEQLETFSKKYQAKLEKEKSKEEVKEETNSNTTTKQSVEQKKEEAVKVEAEELQPEEEKSGGGLGAILIGGVILVATLGAVNILRNK